MNCRRATWARHAVHRFADETGLSIAGEGYAAVLSDLVCDLQHLARLEGLDWAAILDSADQSFVEEVIDAQEECRHADT